MTPDVFAETTRPNAFLICSRAPRVPTFPLSPFFLKIDARPIHHVFCAIRRRLNNIHYVVRIWSGKTALLKLPSRLDWRTGRSMRSELRDSSHLLSLSESKTSSDTSRCISCVIFSEPNVMRVRLTLPAARKRIARHWTDPTSHLQCPCPRDTSPFANHDHRSRKCGDRVV